MKGKNVIKVNPDVKEGTVIVKDAKGNDFVEIVDIISPSDVRSDWKKAIVILCDGHEIDIVGGEI